MPRKEQILVRLLFAPLLLLAIVAGAQDFKIRAKVDLVEVPVTVKSSGDKLITGLTKNDFIVLEDKQRQTIANFTIDPVPLSAVVVIDTGLSADSLSKVQKTFPALAGAFSEFDEVAIYRVNKFVTKVLDFSQNTERIETAMKTLRDLEPDTHLQANLPQGPWPPSPFFIPGPIINGAPVVPPGQLGVIVTTPPKGIKVLHDAIFAAASDLGQRERSRRKIVLVISDGQTTGNEHSLGETAQSLLAKGIQVYAVGLDQPFPYKKLSVLDDYAKTTGGDVIFADSIQSIEQAYSLATEEARNQYVIGYLSNNEPVGPDPIFREIEVEVRGRNLKVLHRKGYYQYP
jgi:VWFA-related protein